MLHPLKDMHEAPQEAIHTCVQERGLVRGALEEVIGLLAERALERDGKRDGEPRKADGEAGAAADVEVGEVVEGSLDLKEVRELVMQRQEARPAGCGRERWSGVRKRGGGGAY